MPRSRASQVRFALHYLSVNLARLFGLDLRPGSCDWCYDLFSPCDRSNVLAFSPGPHRIGSYLCWFVLDRVSVEEKKEK